MKNILLTIEYDGTNFSGWQRQPGQRTVQGELERVLSTLCAQPISLHGTSRTDAGVHALGQRASFQADFAIPVANLQMAANHLLSSSPAGVRSLGKGAPGDLRIKKVEEVAPSFHARFDAWGKTYRYRIRNSQVPDIFARNYCYIVPQRLDLAAMNRAAEDVVGRHDFKCFQAAGGKELESTVRTIYRIEVKEEGPNSQGLMAEDRGITIEVTGDGFLYNMVRILTGTLVEVGLGKKLPEAMSEILASQDRQKAGHTAPPQGLYLKEIYYREEDVQ